MVSWKKTNLIAKMTGFHWLLTIKLGWGGKKQKHLKIHAL